MPTNNYFNGYNEKPQQDLYRDLINEVVRLFGIDCVYIPRTSLSQPDLLFGDDPTKAFVGGYPVAVYIQNTESFEGPQDLFSKFGLIVNKQLRLLIGNTDFQQATSGSIGNRPREGDIIWMKNFQAIFEIKFANQDKFFYAFGAKPFYGFELICEEFRYNNEIINSGVDEIDTKVNTLATAYAATMLSGNGDFTVGEAVSSGSNTAVVVSWNVPTKTLVMKNFVGQFIANAALTGAKSGAVWTLSSIELEHNVNELLENNVLIRTEANTDLDLTESNPTQGNPITSITQEV